MTIPGKGGRPRKWRSDADRRRAWRARQAGGDEPLTLVQAFDDGDELARVWQLVRQLGERLDHANATVGELRRERDHARRALEEEQHRLGWIETRNTDLEAERDRLEAERDDLTIELIETREEIAQLQRTTSTPTRARLSGVATSALSRAQRRQLEREQRRKGI